MRWDLFGLRSDCIFAAPLPLRPGHSLAKHEWKSESYWLASYNRQIQHFAFNRCDMGNYCDKYPHDLVSKRRLASWVRARIASHEPANQTHPRNAAHRIGQLKKVSLLLFDSEPVQRK